MPHPHFVLKMLPETHQGILVFWALAAWISCQQKLYFSSHHNAMSVDWLYYVQVQFSCSVLFDSLWPHGLQHARFLCPSPTPRVYSNSCPLNLWCHLTIWSSAIPSLPALSLSQHQDLSKESGLHSRWPKYWSFSFNTGPSSEHPGLISFRMDRLDLLSVQGTLKSLLQHHSSKASIFHP